MPNRPNDKAGDDSSFDDDAIRSELRRMVKRFESDVMHKLAAAEESFEIDAKAMPEVTDEFRAGMRSKFEAGRSKTSRRFQSIFDFIERR